MRHHLELLFGQANNEGRHVQFFYHVHSMALMEMYLPYSLPDTLRPALVLGMLAILPIHAILIQFIIKLQEV